MLTMVGAIKNGKVTSLNNYNIIYKNNRAKLYNKMNSFKTLKGAKDFLDEKKTYLSYDSIDEYINSIVNTNSDYLLQNISYLKRRSQIKTARKKALQNVLENEYHFPEA